MQTFLIVVHVVIAVAIVGLVLIQQGKGAQVGAAFGGGASGTVFGAQGSATFLSKTTAVLATLFFMSSLSLAWMASGQNSGELADDSVLAGETQPEGGQDVLGVSPLPGEEDVPNALIEAITNAPEAEDVPAISADEAAIDADAGLDDLPPAESADERTTGE